MLDKKVAVVIDYQNVHLTSHEIFDPYGNLQQSLIDPIHFCEEIIRLKNSSNKDENVHFSLSRIEVYRGLPDPQDPRRNYAGNLAQKTHWERESQNKYSCSITYRPLKYKKTYRNNESTIDFDTPPEEKGVDVLCALALVRLAKSQEYDVVILASRDTDLIPALEEAQHEARIKIEAVKWYDNAAAFTRGNLKIESFRMWTTSMKRDSYEKSIDNFPYS
ncbi:MAG: NYN domain-containing protein [Bifidobacteriaceae bacterium]|jgi:uncharacterized LabA/DUF88 family protein|nr:NYN domain-containing protein [Bifidobacteriaceae bacterium]